MTFSIVAVDPETGDCGSAVASYSVAVGGTVCYSRMGVGVVNTQHHAQLRIGNRVLDEMDSGGAPEASLATALQKDDRPGIRQLLVIDTRGRRSAWTGEACADACCHRFGKDCVAAGNYLAGCGVIDEMIRVFEDTAGESLESRLLQALAAGETSGGDRRGKRAAAVSVVPGPERDVAINLDLRIDDHPEPLERLLELYCAFRREFPAGRTRET